MRTRFEPMRPWTRAHEKFVKAWEQLHGEQARLGFNVHNLRRWLFIRWSVETVRELTPAQARAGSRQLHAWRAGVEGRTTVWGNYPRQARRQRRRAEAVRAASNTASTRGTDFENLISGTALAGLGRLMPTESDR